MTPEEALNRMKNPGEWTLRFAPRVSVSSAPAPVRSRVLSFGLAAIAIIAVGAVIAVAAVSRGSSSTSPPVAATSAPTKAPVLRGTSSPWDSKTVDWYLPNTFEEWAEHAKPTRLIVGTIEQLRPGGTFKFQQDSDEGDPYYVWHTGYLGVRETSTNRVVWIEMSIQDSQKASERTVMSSISFPDDPMIFLTDGPPTAGGDYIEIGEPGERPPGTVLSMSGTSGLYFVDGEARSYLQGDPPVLSDEHFTSLDDLADAFRAKFDLK